MLSDVSFAVHTGQGVMGSSTSQQPAYYLASSLPKMGFLLFESCVESRFVSGIASFAWPELLKEGTKAWRDLFRSQA